MEQQPPTTSPIIRKEQKGPMTTLSFPDAIKAIIDGKKITKREWGNEEIYCVLTSGVLSIYQTADKMFHPWTISDGDLMGDDWYILD